MLDRLFLSRGGHRQWQRNKTMDYRLRAKARTRTVFKTVAETGAKAGTETEISPCHTDGKLCYAKN